MIKSGYTHKLEIEAPNIQNPKKKCRKREVLWFNPPFSLNVKTHIGKEFLSLLDKSFPMGHQFRKIFNRSTVKIGYKCMPNMAAAINSHNKKILKPASDIAEQPRCICKRGPDCPVQGTCSQKWVVYSATVTENRSQKTETYTGLTSRPFKVRWEEHLRNFERPDDRNKSKLSGHIWDLKDRGLEYSLSWSIIDKAPPYNPSTKKCLLCLKEKHHIMYDRGRSSLNKRSEVFNTCRHRTQSLLCNLKSR